MSPIGEGGAAALLVVAGGVLPTEIWRWLGLAVGWRINPNSQFFIFVRSAATGIISAFVAHAVFFPTGSLAGTPLWLRIGAVASAILAFHLLGKHVLAGIGAGIAVLLIGLTLVG